MADRTADESQSELISLIESLWERTHLLTANLERPSEEVDLPSLRRTSLELSEGMKNLSARFSELAERITSDRQKEDWEASSAFIAVPITEGRGGVSRDRLWERLANIKKHDREMAAADQAGSTTITDQQLAAAFGRTRIRAETQARMALAALGPRWFDDRDVFPANDQADFSSTTGKVHVASELEPDRIESWSREMALAGDRIGLRWQRIVEVIEQLTNEEDGISDFRAFQERLIKADRLERVVDGGSPRLSSSTTQAAIRLREARVHTLLLAMADRSWEDHWYDEDPKELYYLAVGLRFINDADKLFPQSPPLRRAEQNRAQGRISLSGPASLALTSEIDGRVSYHLGDEGIVPAGLPVVRPSAGQPLEVGSEAEGFHVVQRGQNARSVDIRFRNPIGDRFESDPTVNRPRVVPSVLRLDGFFRGQEFIGTTTISVHSVPDTVAIGPPSSDPPDASIAVRASNEIIGRFGAGTGSIAIVLDCSGSMMNQTVRGRTKFDEAQEALRRVLALVPKGTRLSLWTFSLAPRVFAFLPTARRIPPRRRLTSRNCTTSLS